MKPTILFFCPSFNMGGVEKVFVNLSNFLVNDGYNVNILTCNDAGILKEALSVKVNQFTLNKRLSKSFYRTVVFFNKHDFDVVICGPNFINILSIIVLKLILRKKIKLILTHHTFYDEDVKNMPVIHLFYKFLIKYSYQFSDLIIAVSNAVKNHLISDVKIKSEITVIHNPVIPDNIEFLKNVNVTHKWLVQRSESENIILCIGRLSKVKNQTALIEIALCLKDILNFKLLFIGDGEDKDKLVSLVQKYELESNVDFVHNCINPFKYLYTSDLVVIPSLSETFSLVAVESIASGIPVLSTPTQGVLEVMEKCKDCYFEDINSKSEFLSKIIHILNFYKNNNVDSNYVNDYYISEIGKKYKFVINKLSNEF